MWTRNVFVAKARKRAGEQVTVSTRPDADGERPGRRADDIFGRAR